MTTEHEEGKLILESLPREQLLTLAALGQEHPGSIWHLAECGCCICLHPGGRRHEGWIIGPDGTAEYHAEAHP